LAQLFPGPSKPALPPPFSCATQWAGPAKAAGLPHPCPSPSLTDDWGLHVSGVFLLLLVTEVDTPVESDATPTTSWLDPHVELPLKY
jgi:hypothetical protein